MIRSIAARIVALAALASGTTGVAAGLLWLAQPRWVASWLAAHSRKVLFAVATTQREVALTFDDGPHPQLTPALLEVLRRYEARATFFLLGAQADEHGHIVEDLVRWRNEVGNHMWDDRPSALLSRADFERDLMRTDQVLTRVGGRPVFVRPGSGWIRGGMLRAVAQHGYRLVLGTIAVRDPEIHDLERALNFVAKRIQPGAVVVMHEGYASRSQVVELTDRLLRLLARDGYRAVTLSELTHIPIPAPN